MPAVTRMLPAWVWTDPRFAAWPLPKRLFVFGLWALAEDSGCVEDSPFMWKLSLFPSPLDSEISDGQLSTWRDELVQEGVLIPFEHSAKPYLYVAGFLAGLQKPPNPRENRLPLPPWIEKTTEGEGRGRRIKYVEHLHSDCADTAETLTNVQVGLGGVGSGLSKSKGVGLDSGGGASKAAPTTIECPDCWGEGCQQCNNEGHVTMSRGAEKR